jgi:hypothetical protein
MSRQIVSGIPKEAIPFIDSKYEHDCKQSLMFEGKYRIKERFYTKEINHRYYTYLRIEIECNDDILFDVITPFRIGIYCSYHQLQTQLGEEYLIAASNDVPIYLFNLSTRIGYHLSVILREDEVFPQHTSIAWHKVSLSPDDMTLLVEATRYYLDCETDEYLFYDFPSLSHTMIPLEGNTIHRDYIPRTRESTFLFSPLHPCLIEHTCYEHYYPQLGKLYCQLEFDRMNTHYNLNIDVFYEEFHQFLNPFVYEIKLTERRIYERRGNAMVKLCHYECPELEKYHIDEANLIASESMHKAKLL